MHTAMHTAQLALLIGIGIGSLVWLFTLGCAIFFRSQRMPSQRFEVLPPVSLLKPVCGLEKNLRENLRTACLQDYPDYQVVYSVQRRDDPAIPLLHELEREFGKERVTVAIENVEVGLNGKINNLAGALPHAHHEILVISDSDVRLRPDYLKTIVTPLADPEIGCVSTFFRASDAGPWYEMMEQLMINTDHFAMAIFASVIHVVDFCFGASTALTKTTLASIGGLPGLGDYLVEDNEMGRRIARSGKKVIAVPYVVDTMTDLQSASQWWQKMTYWDQNTKAAVPGVFVACLLLRIVPLGLLFALLRGFDAVGLEVLLGAIAVRVSAASAVLGLAARDFRGLQSVWMVPIKDTLSLFWFVRAFLTRTVIWRGVEMTLTSDGRLRPLAQDTMQTEHSS
jgi:ceramide glucosyltransferase